MFHIILFVSVFSNDLLLQWLRITYSAERGHSSRFEFPLTYNTFYTAVGFSEGKGGFMGSQFDKSNRDLSHISIMCYGGDSNNNTGAANCITIGF